MNENDLKRHQINGYFGDPQITSATNPIQLTELLSYPFFWKSGKISSFFRDSWQFINIKGADAEVDSFKEILKTESGKAFPLQCHDWTLVLEEAHFEILKKEGAKSANPGRVRLRSGNGNFESVVELLRTIRNKVEHYKEFGDDEKATLGWFTNGDLDDHKCVTYWLKKFPKLLPFLWSKYCRFRDRPTLKAYYSSTLDKNRAFCFSWGEETVIKDVIAQFNRALDIHLEAGGLEKRYTCTRSSPQPATSFILEFRILESETITALLDRAVFVEIKLCEEIMSFGWCEEGTGGITNNKYVLKYCARIPNVPLNQGSEDEEINTCVIVASSFKDEYLVSKGLSKKVIFFINECFLPAAAIIKSTAEKFAHVNNVTLEETPLAWCKSYPRMSILENAGEVIFQNKMVKLSSILPDNVDDRESVLSTLKGDVLNELLRKGKPVLFDKYKIPKLVEPYLHRRLCSCREISSKVLRHRSLDKIIVTNISLVEMKKLAKNENIFKLETVNDLSTENFLTHRLFLLEKIDVDDSAILTRLGKKHPDTNIHYLQFLRDNTFQWQWSYGSLSIIKKSFVKKATDMVVMNEQEFLDNIEVCEPEPIFIADKPGMGKSFVLISLANKMSSMFLNSFVIFLNASEFVATLKKKIGKNKQRNCNKADIVTVIQDTVSTTEFEHSLVNSWIEQAFPNTKMTIELMLDGLDEVDKKDMELAIQVLKLIRHELTTVRLWVTLRQHMQDEIEKQFSVLNYKIQPLTETEQVYCLKKFWSSQNENAENGLNLEELESLAVKCIRLSNAEIETTEIAGAPLQCRMLGEIIYENYLFDGDHKEISLDSISLTKLYERMIEKKLKDYLTVKLEVPKPPDFMLEMYRKQMESCHILLANKLLFSDCMENAFSKALNVAQEKDELVKELGIVENLEPIRFIHRTFGEYFVALFIHKVLIVDSYKLESGDVEKFQKLFLSQVLEVTKNQITPNTVGSKFKIPVLCHFLNAMLEGGQNSPSITTNILGQIHDFNSDTEFEDSKSIILATLYHNYFNLAQLLLGSLNKEAMHTFLEKTKEKHTQILEITVRFASGNFFKYICSLIENWHEERGSNYKIATDLFKLALEKGKYSIVKFLVENNKGFDEKTWHSFHMNDKKKFGIIHHVIGKSRKDKEWVLEEKKKLLEYIVKKDRNTLEQKDKEGRTPILIPFSANFRLKSFLIRLGADVNAKGHYNNTAFHWTSFSNYRSGISPHEYHEMLQCFLNNDFKEINSVNNNGITPLQCAINTYHDSLKEETLELFQNADADFNANYKDGGTILHTCIQKGCRIQFIEKLIQCGCEISETDSKEQNALEAATASGNLLLVKILKEKYGAVDFGNCDNDREE